MPGSCGEEARHKKVTFFEVLGAGKAQKRVTFCAGLLRGCRALAGKPFGLQGSGLRAQGSGLRA